MEGRWSLREKLKININYAHNIDIENIRLYKRLLNNKRKDGFTLIEVIAVIAIIGIMVSVLMPKFTGYINEAKKLKVIEQSRKVVMAVECHNMKVDTTSSKISKTASLDEAMKKREISKYFENTTEDINKLDLGMKISECYDIVNGAEFELDPENNYKYKLGTGTTSVATGEAKSH